MGESATNKRAEFARYIKGMRERKGLSKFRASQALGYKSDGVINQVEQGRTPIPIEKIHPIAQLYQLELDELLQKIEEYEPELFAKYMVLEKAFFEDFTKRLRTYSGNRSSFVSDRGQDGERIARHHLPYPALPDLVDRLYIIRSTNKEELIPPELRLLCATLSPFSWGGIGNAWANKGAPGPC